MRDEEVLANALVELERTGGNAEVYLASHGGLSPEVRAALRAADWTRRASRRAAPAAEFRRRARQRFLVTVVDQRERRRSRWGRVPVWLLPRMRFAVAPLAVVFALIVGSVGVYGASAAALPETPLYPAKLVFDQLRFFTALTPEQVAQAHEVVAAERLREAQVEQQTGHPDLAARLLMRYQAEVAQVRTRPIAQVQTSSSTLSSALPSATSSAAPSIVPPVPTPPEPAPTQPEVARVAAPAAREVAPPSSTPDNDNAATEGEAPGPARAAVATAATRRLEAPGVPPASDSSPSPHGTGPAPTAAAAPAVAPTALAIIAAAPAVAPTASAVAPAAPPVSPVHPTPIPVPPTSVPPTATPVPTTVPTNDEVVLHRLLREAASDDPAAALTLREYVQSIQAARLGGDGWAARLKVERGVLVAALPHLSPAARTTLQTAIGAIDAVLGASQASAASVPRHPSPTPSPFGSPHRLLDQSAHRR